MSLFRTGLLAIVAAWTIGLTQADSPNGPGGKGELQGKVFRSSPNLPTHHNENGDAALAIAAAYSPDGKLVATSGWDKLVRLWDATTGKPIRRFEGHVGPIYSAVFSPDGRTLASCSEDRSIRLWDVATAKQKRLIEGHTGGVTRVAFTPDGRFLASGSYDQSVRLWRVEDGKLIRTFEERQKGFTTICFSSDGRYLASGCGKQEACVWETATGRLIRRFQGHRDAVVGVAFSPDGLFLATASEDRGVFIWEIWSGRPMLQLRGHRAGAWSVAFSPDGRVLASAGRDNTIRFWDANTGSLLCLQTNAHRQGIPMLAYSPDGRQLVSASHDANAASWDVARVRPPQMLPGAALADSELSDLWDQLALTDTARAYSAIGRLTLVPRQAVPFLSSRVQPVRPSSETRVSRLIADLDSNSFRTRHKANEELEKLAESFEPTLRLAVGSKPSLEFSQRLDRLLDRLERPMESTDLLRQLHAVRVLECVATPEARAHLAKLADGAPGALLTVTARQALDRLSRRASR